MKTIFLFIILIFLSGFGKLFAQDALVMAFPEDSRKPSVNASSLPVFEFNASSFEHDLSSVSTEMVGDHVFGKLISEKLFLLDAKYTYQAPIVPGNPQTKTIVRKPVVYDAVLKIERYLKKEVKKGEISMEEATNEFSKVLDVAFNVLTADTDSFERAINKTNDTNSLTILFTKQVKLVF